MWSIEFNNWFARKTDNETRMYAGNIIPTISFIFEKDFIAINIQVFFWDLTFERRKNKE